MMYALVPAGSKRPYYLASWSATVNLLGAFGPLTGALVARHLADLSIDIEGFTITNLHIVFLLSAATRVAPILLLQLVQDRSTLTARGLLSNLLRGNFLSYAFNAARDGDRRALACARRSKPLIPERHRIDSSRLLRRASAAMAGTQAMDAAFIIGACGESASALWRSADRQTRG